MAIQADPNYAAGLADTYFLSDAFPPDVRRSKTAERVSKALKLDNTLAGAHLSLAAIKIFFDWGAETEIQDILTFEFNFFTSFSGMTLRAHPLPKELSKDCYEQLTIYVTSGRSRSREQRKGMIKPRLLSKSDRLLLAG